MKKVHLLFVLVFIYNTGLAQLSVPAFGRIDAADLRLESCSFDSNAVAMTLFDIQDSEYEHSTFSNKVRMEKRVRIKIFSEKGYPFAAIRFPYYNNKKNTTISDLKGIVYTLDKSGNIITHTIPEADFFKEKAASKVGLLSFTFPHLQPGCVIEYSFVLTEKNSTNFPIWEMQSQLPIAYSSNTLIFPAYSSFREYSYGDVAVTKKTEDIKKGLDKKKVIFYRENIPAFRPEPYMSSASDNILRMVYLLFETGNPIFDNTSTESLWKLIANQMLKGTFFDEQYQKKIPGTEKIIDTALSFRNIEDKVKYLYHVIKSRVPESKGAASFPDDIAETWKKRSGTSADINMLLMNFLKRSGIKCHPVLISTRENGKINMNFPNFGQFDGMDVLVAENNLTYLIDASLRYQPYNIPPVNILNRHVFILDPDNIRWANVSDDRPLMKQNTSIFGSITKQGIVEAGATITYTDYAKSLILDSSNNRAGISDNVLTDKKTAGIKLLSNNKTVNGDGEPMIQALEFDYELQESGEFFSIDPRLLALVKTNPFLLERRNTDIDFGCNQEISLSVALQMPDNYQVENMPKSILVRSPDSSFVFTRITNVSQSSIHFTHTLEIKKTIFDKNEYAGLYEFYKRIFALMSEEIILKKKT